MIKILIIDDEKDILETISALLDAFIDGCDVLTANSGSLGIEMAKKYLPDTILLDVTMPVMDGFQVCQILKQDEDTKDIPVIILTGVHTDSKSKIKGLEIGADTFLSKPIKEGELVAHVKAMLRIKRAEDELKKEKELLNFLVKQRTEELEKARKRYQQLYDFAPDLYFSVRPDGTIFSVNQFGADYLGYKTNDLVGKPIWETFFKDDQKKVEKQLSEIFNKKIINSDWEFRQVRKNGSIIWVQEKTHLFLNEKGYAKELLIMCRDVTVQKQAEDAIRESEQHYRTLFEQANDAILLENDKGNIIDFNLLTLKSLGYTRDELVNMKVNDLIEPGNPLFYDNKKYSELKLSDPTIFETKIIHKNGQKISVEVTVTPLNRKTKKFCLLILRDLTERKKIEEEEQKTQKLESIGILAGGIAHDFNNRLSVILGNAQLARMAMKNQGNIDKYLGNIEKGAALATSLTQQLLTFSRGGAPVKKIHSIKEILKESVGLSLSGSKSNCKFFFPDNLWAVEVDEGQLVQVINNLIINADQAMADGGTVEVFAENVPKKKKKPHIALQPGYYVKVTIMDHGIGIPPDDMDKIFDPYFTTKHKGSGLGLAVAYSIIKKHNGVLTAESKLGEGSSFIFYLPAIPDYQLSENESAEQLYKGHGRVLVMDDEEAVLSVIENFLTVSGYDVELAKDGAEAVEIYKKAKDMDDPFRLVIMDLTIQGGMGGKETIAKLKKVDPNVKAVVSSGYSNDPIMANYKDYGFNGVIAKPYKMVELSQVLHNILSEV
ncbi:PAS domain S-box protein [candidate division KSB1 bacterium]|nr:PAS domain S-box protein [candidate division KSB1 bacterium]